MHSNKRDKGVIVVSYNRIFPPVTATDDFNYHKIEGLHRLRWSRSLILQGQKESVEKYPYFMDGRVRSLTSEIKGRLFRHFVYYFFCAFTVIKLRRDYGVLYFIGAEFLPLALFAKIFLGYKVVGDVDTYTIAYRKGEIMSYGFYDLTERLFEPFMVSCDVSSVINERDRDILISKGFHTDKLLIMPPSRDLPEVDPTRISAVRSEFISKLLNEGFLIGGDSIIITFHGSATAQHNKKTIDNIITEVVPKVLEKDSRCFFLIIGGGYELNPTFKSKYGMNIHFTGFLEDTRMKDLLSISDLYIAPMTLGAKGGTKTKIIEAAMFGLPVITTPEVEEQYFRNACPIIKSDISNFSDAVLNITRNREQLKEIGHLTRIYVNENYSSDNYSRYGSKIASLLELSF